MQRFVEVGGSDAGAALGSQDPGGAAGELVGRVRKGRDCWELSSWEV
jgi:hypothetical protein